MEQVNLQSLKNKLLEGTEISKYKKSPSGWYLIEKYSLYDRDNILEDTFITQTPDKYLKKEYKIKPIKTK